MRRPSTRTTLQIALGLIVAFGIAATRSEKLFAELAASLPRVVGIMVGNESGHAPFDPARVPQSGGMASRLLAGIVVKPV